MSFTDYGLVQILERKNLCFKLSKCGKSNKLFKANFTIINLTIIYI